MCGHLRLNDFLDGSDKIVLYTAPCCCCLRFLNPVSATEYAFIRLSGGGQQAIFKINFVHDKNQCFLFSHMKNFKFKFEKFFI